MTMYRLMDGASGRPGNGPASPVSYTGNYIAGIMFEVTQGGMWLEGYWWWVCPSGQPAGATKCALWSVGVPNGGGTLVPGSVVTSGPLTPGAWNYIPLAAPLQLAIGSPYTAAIAVNGSFPQTTSQFGAGQPYAAGIASGPLTAYSDTSGSLPAPYGHAQGGFTTAGTDPAASMPLSGNSSSNLWADIQVSDTAPAGYAGSWRLWPNKYDAAPTVSTDAASPFTLSTEIHLTAAANANWVWFFSPPGVTQLPTWCGIYRISDQSLVTANTSPSWLTPSGSAGVPGAGWVKAAVSAPLAAGGQYKAAVYNGASTLAQWSPTVYGYWKTGGGQNGITSGPLHAPPAVSASGAYVFFNNPSQTPPYTDGHSQEPGQGTYAMTGPRYPYLYVDYQYPGASDPAGAVAESFWVDMEVTPLAASSGLLMSAGII